MERKRKKSKTIFFLFAVRFHKQTNDQHSLQLYTHLRAETEKEKRVAESRNPTLAYIHGIVKRRPHLLRAEQEEKEAWFGNQPRCASPNPTFRTTLPASLPPSLIGKFLCCRRCF